MADSWDPVWGMWHKSSQPFIWEKPNRGYIPQRHGFVEITWSIMFAKWSAGWPGILWRNPTTTNRIQGNNVTTVPGPPCHVVSSNPCAGNYGSIDPCCDQEGDTVDPQWQCPQSKPTCVDYVYNDHWGFCEKKVLLNWWWCMFVWRKKEKKRERERERDVCRLCVCEWRYSQ